MYIPRTFSEQNDDVLHAFMRASPFAALVSASNGLFATHLPLLLQATADVLTLEGHIARANEHCHRLREGDEVLVIFTGAQAHITPVWYPSKAEHGKVVPTWNYVAVHATGTVRVIQDPAWLHAHVSRLSEVHETSRGSEWRTSDAPSEYVTAQLRAIVGIEVLVTSLEGKWKMSQNRDEADVRGVVDGLRAQDDASDTTVAELVADRMPPARKR